MFWAYLEYFRSLACLGNTYLTIDTLNNQNFRRRKKYSGVLKMFNVRIKRFLDAEQIQIFSQGFHSAGEVVRRQVDEETGEIFVKKRLKKPVYHGDWMECPFAEDELEYLYDMDELAKLEWEERKRKEDSTQQSKARTVNTIYDIARSNRWEWFVTLTFAPDKVNRFDYSECQKKLTSWLNHTRRICPDMLYLVVPEQHKKGGFHFHGLFANIDQLTFTASGHLDKQGRPIYNIGNYKLGFTTATRIGDISRASSYLCKYITKDLCSVTVGKKRYWASRNVQRPEVIEILSDLNMDDRLAEALRGRDEYHIKQLHTAYTDVLYIDVPIYTTNTTGFSKAHASDN